MSHEQVLNVAVSSSSLNIVLSMARRSLNHVLLLNLSLQGGQQFTIIMLSMI